MAVQTDQGAEAIVASISIQQSALCWPAPPSTDWAETFSVVMSSIQRKELSGGYGWSNGTEGDGPDGSHETSAYPAAGSRILLAEVGHGAV